MESIPKQYVREYPTAFITKEQARSLGIETPAQFEEQNFGPVSIWNEARKEKARASLKKWEGTPHRDRIAIVGIGIDCINLVYQVLLESDVVEQAEFGGYDLQDGLHRLSDRLVRVMRHCTWCEILDPGIEPPEFGDVLIFKTGKRSGHCGFYADENVWHSLARQSVIDHPYKAWQNELQALCRIRATGWRNHPRTATKI